MLWISWPFGFMRVLYLLFGFWGRDSERHVYIVALDVIGMSSSSWDSKMIHMVLYEAGSVKT